MDGAPIRCLVTWPPAPNRYDDMRHRRTGRSGLLLPLVSLGRWHNFGHERRADVVTVAGWRP